ncbi:glycosyl transferase family 90-domain-containing protein [Lasiosphaeria miniovina]|uniref:Glycosyl transferase family 90-domain-containing protein n=1 Tax=Lasiosphaeria miniovina TaxID=1954250 RepID=A0AA40ECI2_9PEZI|nr:glycosyl transferase family 90-domain-containing protein [Lasiosphaeria miniovina]KAK0733267.1 glycosyl transferase family 90-domain-containing protein [Lasiosphaeria miniovina]
MLKARQRRQIRQLTLLLGSCLALFCLVFVWRTPSDDDYGDINRPPSMRISPYAPRPALPSEALENLSLGEGECEATFPGLTKEIDDAVAQGPFKVKQTGDLGPLQGRIKDGKIYIIHAQRKADLSKEMVNSRSAALHQLHRALVTSPTPLPDTVFTLNFQDQPFGTAWTYSRPALLPHAPTDPNSRTFLMPHFSFWAWKLPFVGSMGRGAKAITALEREYEGAGRWNHKIPKAIWRGTTWFNSIHSPRLRQHLVAAAKGQAWADVQPLQWKGDNASNALPIEEFCRYKYVLHTEGVSYSGRFQFVQMCASVVITPPMHWMQHTTHLVRPLFSSSLDLSTSGRSKKAKGSGRWDARKSKSHAKTARGGPAAPAASSWEPSERIRKAWPVQYSPEEANIVFVAPDWSDLGDTIAWLEANPRIAEGIGRRQRDLFVGGGYFSQAAEACYWRALVRGWAKMARIDGEGWEDTEDTSFEAFTLTNGD